MVEYIWNTDEFKLKIRKVVLHKLQEYVRAYSDLDLLSVQEEEEVHDEIEVEVKKKI